MVYLPGAERERAALSAVERNALHNAVVKLEALGPALRHPHTSAVQGVASLRELRPRAGRSAWRALYRQVGERFVIAARSAPKLRRTHQAFDGHAAPPSND